MATRRKKQKIVEVKVKLNVGHPCKNCGKRYINPFKHVCVSKKASRTARQGKRG